MNKVTMTLWIALIVYSLVHLLYFPFLWEVFSSLILFQDNPFFIVLMFLGLYSLSSLYELLLKNKKSLNKSVSFRPGFY